MLKICLSFFKYQETKFGQSWNGIVNARGTFLNLITYEWIYVILVKNDKAWHFGIGFFFPI